MFDRQTKAGHLEFFVMFSNVFHCYLLSFSLSRSLTISLAHSFTLSHYFNLSLNHSCHAEQLLFSSLCSKVTLIHTHKISLSHTLSLFQSLIQSLSTCSTSFVLISMLKIQCLSANIAMLFLTLAAPPPPSPVTLEFIELFPS